MRDASKTIQERVASTHVKDLDIDLDAMAAISNIFRVSVLFRSTAERKFLSENNISFSGFTVLWVVWVWGRKQAFELAEECGIAKGTLTGIVKTLEKNELAKAVAHENDKRRKYIEISDKGSQLMAKLFKQLNDLEIAFTSDLEKSEQQELSRMLRIILHTGQEGIRL